MCVCVCVCVQLTVVKSVVEGVEPGDKLVALNGESLVGATFADVMDKYAPKPKP